MRVWGFLLLLTFTTQVGCSPAQLRAAGATTTIVGAGTSLVGTSVATGVPVGVLVGEESAVNAGWKEPAPKVGLPMLATGLAALFIGAIISGFGEEPEEPDPAATSPDFEETSPELVVGEELPLPSASSWQRGGEPAKGRDGAPQGEPIAERPLVPTDYPF